MPPHPSPTDEEASSASVIVFACVPVPSPPTRKPHTAHSPIPVCSHTPFHSTPLQRTQAPSKGTEPNDGRRSHRPAAAAARGARVLLQPRLSLCAPAPRPPALLPGPDGRRAGGFRVCGCGMCWWLCVWGGWGGWVVVVVVVSCVVRGAWRAGRVHTPTLCRGLNANLTPPPTATQTQQWGMNKRKDQKKDGAVRPEDVPGGAYTRFGVDLRVVVCG